MMNGDISNDSPPSVLVNLDVLAVPDVRIHRILGLFPVTRMEHRVDMRMASALHRVASASSYTWEAFSIGMDDADAVVESLEQLGLNPFRWSFAVDSPQALMREVAYRRTVVAIVDRSSRALAYGSLYVDLGLIDGT